MKKAVNTNNPIPVSTFKDECGYILVYSDGTHEEVPVRTLSQMKKAMCFLGFTITKKSKDGEYIIKKGSRHEL